MSFLAPLAFAFAGTLPVVVLFYLLKRKRVVRLVSSTILWQRFLSESQASAPFQRLRHHWLLILQLLMLALVIFGLARPYFSGKQKGGRLLVAILDGSASMQSRDESPSRFAKARAEARALADSLQDSDRMVVLLAAGATEVRQSPTSQKSALRRAIDGCRPADTATKLIEAFRLAQPLVRDQPDAEVHLFSDGAVPGLGDSEFEGMNVVFHKVGKRCANVGIVNLDVRAHPDDPARRAVFASVANPGSNVVETLAELSFNGRVVESRPVQLRPRETLPLVFSTAQDEQDGVFTLRLAVEDDLECDNTASVVSQMPQPARVLLLSRGNRFLERALSAVPQSKVTVTQGDEDSAEYDLTVIDDVIPAKWPQGNVLAIRSAAPGWLNVDGRVEGPPIVDWVATHPLLRFVGFDNVQVAESLKVKTPGWAQSVVESPATSLILAGERDRQRVVWIGFDLLQSNWPLRVSFPIFIANVVEWLNPASQRAGLLNVRAGDPLKVPVSPGAPSVGVTLPDGSKRALPVAVGAKETGFAETWLHGVYRFASGTNQTSICVNLLSATETDTTPREEVRFGRYTRSAATTVKPASVETWRWFAALGLSVLLFEWWFYHRRTA